MWGTRADALDVCEMWRGGCVIGFYMHACCTITNIASIAAARLRVARALSDVHVYALRSSSSSSSSSRGDGSAITRLTRCE